MWINWFNYIIPVDEDVLYYKSANRCFYELRDESK